MSFAAAPLDKSLKPEEFQFKLHNAVKIGKDSIPAQHSFRMSAVAANNKYGAIAVACDTGVKLFSLEDLVSQSSSEPPKHILDVQIGSQPRHVSFNSDGTLLAIYVAPVSGTTAIYVYNIIEQKPPAVIYPGSSTLHLMDLAWNPASPTLLSVIFSDLKVQFCTIEGSTAKQRPVQLAEQATCMSWSPKGKQLAVGALSGAIVRVDQAGKTTFTIPPPPDHSSLAVIGLFWQSTYTYFAVFGERAELDRSDSPKEPSFMTIRHGKDKPLVYIDYSDIWLCSAGSRVNAMLFAPIAPWEMVLTMTSNAMDAAMIVYDKVSDQWSVATLDDTSRVSVPMRSEDDYSEHSAIGLAISFNSTSSIALTDSYTHPPSPVLCLLSTDGSLILYHIVNRLPSVEHALVVPPQPLTLPTALITAPGASQASQQKVFKPLGSAFTQPSTFAQTTGSGQSLGSGQPSTTTPSSGLVPAATTSQAPLFGGKPILGTSSTASSLFGTLGTKPFGSSSAPSFSGFGMSVSGSKSSFGSSFAALATVEPEKTLLQTPQSTPQSQQMLKQQQPTQPSQLFQQPAALFKQPQPPGQQPSQPPQQPSQQPQQPSQQPQQPSQQPQQPSQQPQQPSQQPQQPFQQPQKPSQQPQQPSQQPHQPSQQPQLSQQPQHPVQPEEPQAERVASEAEPERDELAEAEKRTRREQAEILRLERQAAEEEAAKQRRREEKREAELEIQRQTEAAYQGALRKETDKFNKDLEKLRQHIAQPVSEIVTGPELYDMSNSIDRASLFSTEIKENVKAVNDEIHTLHMRVLDSLSYVNQMQSLYHKAHDPQYRTLINARPLDPKLSKLKQSIEQRFQYMKQQLVTTDAHLDELWLAAHQDKPKGRGGENASRTDIIYRTLATIERIIAVKRQEVDDLVQKLGLLSIRRSSLRSTDINSSSSLVMEREVPESPNAKNVRKALSSGKAEQLRDFLMSRPGVPVVKSAPANLRPSTIQSDLSARRTKILGAKASPPRPTNATSSTKAPVVHQRSVDIPKKVTQSQPTGLAQPIANRLDTKQTLGPEGTNKPVLSKISQPITELPFMRGGKPAFNIPAEPVAPTGRGFAPVSSGTGSPFNKTPVSKDDKSLVSSQGKGLFPADPLLTSTPAVGATVHPKNLFGQGSQASTGPASGSSTSVFGGGAGKSSPSVFGSQTSPSKNGGLFSFKSANPASLPSFNMASTSKGPLPVFGSTAPASGDTSKAVSKGILGGPLPSSNLKQSGDSIKTSPSTGKGSPSKAPLQTTPSAPLSTQSSPSKASLGQSLSSNQLKSVGTLGLAGTSTQVTDSSLSTTTSTPATTPFSFTPKVSVSSGTVPSTLALATSHLTSSSNTSSSFTLSTGLKATGGLSDKLAAKPTTTAASVSSSPAGSQPPKSSSVVKSLFGSQTAVSTATPAAIFGAKPVAASAAPASAFGATSTTASTPPASVFGGQPTPGSTAPVSVVGASSPTDSTAPTSVFGSQPTTASTLPTSVFGGQPTPASTPPVSVFKTASTTTSAAPASVFGATSTVASATPASIFGAQPTPGSTAPASVFGATSTVASAAPASIFGGQPTTASTAPAPIFGIQSVATSTASASATGVPSTTAGATPAPILGSQPATDSATPAPILGGQPATASATPASVLGGQPATASKASASAVVIQSVATGTARASAVGTPSTTASAKPASVLGAQSSTTSTEPTHVFGAHSVATSATPGSLFGATSMTANTTPGSIFGATSTTASTTPASIFGAATANVSTTPGSIFGATSTTVSTAPGSIFRTTSTTASTAPGSIFGATSAAVNATLGSIFGTTSTTASTTPASIFGATSTTANATSASVFGAPSATANVTPSSVFGAQPAATSAAPASIFGAVSQTVTSASSGTNLFGAAGNTTSPFGSNNNSAGSAFGGATSAFGTGKSVFGGTTAGGGAFGLGGTPDPEKAKQNPFGKSSASGANAAKDLFGGVKSSAFGAPVASVASPFGTSASTTPASPFGAATASTAAASPFGGGAAGSASTPSFGSPSFGGQATFGAKPAFGGAATFGSQPAFGAKATFGASSGFGTGTTSAFGGSSTFGASAQQELPNFGSLANASNTPTFGSIASNPQASPFGQQPTSAFGSPGFGNTSGLGQATSSPFGGAASPQQSSSFTSYR